MADRDVFNFLNAAGRLTEVGMDEVGFLSPGGLHDAIGTRSLGGCSVVVIMGQAIILSHVAPYPTNVPDNGNSDGQAGLRHFASELAKVRELFNSHSDLFRTGTVAWGIFARYNGEIMLDHYLAFATRFFSSMGLPTEPAFYDVPSSPPSGNEEVPPGRGTVVALLGAADSEPQLFVENVLKRRAREQPTPSQRPLSTAARPAASSSARVQASVDRWVVAGDQYVRYQGSTQVSSQSRPPLNTPIQTPTGYVTWDGRGWRDAPAPETAQQSTAASTGAETQASGDRWLFAGGQYVRMQGTRQVSSQPNPPANTPIQTTRGYMVWNGREWRRP